MWKREADWLDGKRVLVVEDERLIALDNQDLLEEWGCRVIGPVNTVSAALELIEADLPDAAVLDFHLGGETSEPVAEALTRANRGFIVTTGYEREHLGPYAAQGRIFGKPVDVEALRKALAELLSQ
jgi:CheY-like chemotaxis protein